MADRILTGAWWTTVMSLIALTGVAAMYSAYRGVFSTFAGAYLEGTIFLLACFVVGAACYLLCRHRNDLVCD